MNNRDMQKVLLHLRQDPVVRAVYDAKSEEIGPNIFRFKAEIGAPSPICIENYTYIYIKFYWWVDLCLACT